MEEVANIGWSVSIKPKYIEQFKKEAASHNMSLIEYIDCLIGFGYWYKEHNSEPVNAFDVYLTSKQISKKLRIPS